MEKAYKYRIYPNKKQKEIIVKTFGCRRFVYKQYLAQRIELYQTDKKKLPLSECSNAMTLLKNELEWLKEVDSTGRIIRTIDRSKLYNTQTPQAFKTSIIKDAHEKLKEGNFTDDCSMLEELNIPVYIVNGSYTNIKITIKSDLDFAKLYI